MASDLGGAGTAVAPARPAPDLDARRTAARGGLLTLGGAAYAAASGFALTVVVGRLFGAHQAGLFFMAVAVFTILNGAVVAGSDTGLVRALSAARAVGAHRDVRTVLRVSVLPVLAWSIVVAGVLAAAAAPLAGVLAPGDATVVARDLRVLALTLVVSGIGQACLNGTRSFGGPWRFVVLYQLWLPSSRLLLVVVLWHSDLGVGWLLVAWAVPLVVMDLAALTWLARAAAREARRPGHPPRPPRAVLADVWRFNLPRGVASMLEIGIVWVDVILVGALLGPAAAGAYAAASRFITSGTMAMEALRIGTAPQLAESAARGEPHRVQDLHAVSSVWLVLLSWPVFVTLAAFAPLVLALVGEEFVTASGAMSVMALGILGYLAMGNINSVLLMAGHSRVTAANTLLALTVNIALNLVLVPAVGLAGAAVAWAVSLTLDSLLCTIAARRLLGVRPPWQSLTLAGAVVGIAFGVPAVLVRLLAAPTLGWLAAYAVVGGAVYVALLLRARGPLSLGSVPTLRRGTP